MPKVQFKEGSYKVDESDGEVKATVYRSGDTSIRSTVRCYTRQGSAQVMMDYNERPNTDASIITFLPGETSLPVFHSFFPVIPIVFLNTIITPSYLCTLTILPRRDREAMCCEPSG